MKELELYSVVDSKPYISLDVSSSTITTIQFKKVYEKLGFVKRLFYKPKWERVDEESEVPVDWKITTLLYDENMRFVGYSIFSSLNLDKFAASYAVIVTKPVIKYDLESISEIALTCNDWSYTVYNDSEFVNQKSLILGVFYKKLSWKFKALKIFSKERRVSEIINNEGIKAIKSI